MSKLMEKVYLSVLFLLFITKLGTAEESINYVAKTVLPDGEQEARMRLGNVIVRETWISHTAHMKTGEEGKRGMMLRQVADGPDFLQLIYKVTQAINSDVPQHFKMMECEVMNDWVTANKFKTKFLQEIRRISPSLMMPPNNGPVETSQEESDELQNEIKIEETEISLMPEELKNTTVRLLTKEDITEDMKKSIDIKSHTRRCKRFQRKLKQIVEFKKRSSKSSTWQSEKSRSRRETYRMGIMPGTLWCGDGTLAAEGQETLGAHVQADSCCRTHDGCPYVIDALSTGYGIFNFRMHTISHCACDERFRSCLKQTNTAASNFVGKIFFNVVQTKCFVLKVGRTCAKHSWWGKCIQYDFEKQAHLRDPLPY